MRLFIEHMFVPSPDGIGATHPSRAMLTHIFALSTSRLSADLLDRLGEEPFDLIVSTEVVEHLYDPGTWAAGCYGALRSGGKLIFSTPYHGWLKNVAVAAANKSDFHHHPLGVGGHIKFFSNKMLSMLPKRLGLEMSALLGWGAFRLCGGRSWSLPRAKIPPIRSDERKSQV